MENEEHFDELYENPRGFLDRVVADVVEGVGEERVEAEEDVLWRKDLLRKIGYKL